MDKKNTQTKQQATENSTSDARRTRHSTRIQERAVDATAVVSHKATMSDVPRTRRAARSTSTSNSSKRKHEGVNEKDNTTTNATNTQQSKKYKITASSSNLIPKQPSTAIVQEALVASLVVIQDVTVPRVTKYNKM